MRTGETGEAAVLSGLPPGPELPPARQSRRWIGRPVSFLRELQAEHGDLFTLQLQYQDPWVVVADPVQVKQVFTAPSDVLHSGEANAHLVPALGLNSLLTLDGPAHLRHRRLLLPSFQGEHVARYREIVRAATERELESWPRGEAGPAAQRMLMLTLEVILRAVFGVEERESLDPLRGALNALVRAAEGARLALLGRGERLGEERFAEFRAALALSHELVLAEIARHRADPRLGERDDVMSLLLQARYEDGSAMTDVDLRDELMTLLLAGHETTAMSLAWALEQLARNPEALRRLEAEAEEGGGPYTEAAIRETLRICPVFAVVARKVKQPFELGGYTIPAGVTIMPSPVLVHHRPDLYPQPDEFRPERFLEQPPGTYTWIPFGGGVRRCLGAGFAQLEMQVVLATLLARVHPRPLRPEPEGAKRRLITLGPAQGAQLILEQR
jgi:cytochrome P450